RFEIEAFFRSREVQRQNGLTAAALLRSDFLPFAREKIIHRRQHEGTKASALRICAGERLPLQESREKFLSEILGIVRIVTTAPDINVKRVPVRLTQLSQCFLRLGRLTASSRQHDRPMRRDKRRTPTRGVSGGSPRGG